MTNKVEANESGEAAAKSGAQNRHWDNWPGVWRPEAGHSEPPETIEFGDYDEMTEERPDYWKDAAKQRKNDRRRRRLIAATTAARSLMAKARVAMRWAKVQMKRRFRALGRRPRKQG